MLLRPNAPKLRPLRESGWQLSFDDKLPDLALLRDTALGVPQIGMITGEIALDSMVLLQKSTQQAFGGLVQSIGIPSLKVFRDVVQTFKIDVQQDVVNALEAVYTTIPQAIEAMRDADESEGGQAMVTAAQAGVSTALDATVSLPVVGFLVRLAWTVGKLGAKIWRLTQEDYGAAQRIYPPSRFEPETDIRILNGMLAEIRTRRDWSKVFGPPALGQGQGNLRDYYVKRTEVGLEVFRTPGYAENGQPINWGAQGWIGMVPGTATLHSGISVVGDEVEDIGATVAPSARNMGTVLWKQVTAKDALAPLFTVHADAMAGWWTEYIHELHTFIYETGDLSSGDKQRIVSKMNKDGSGDRIFGWGTSVHPTANEWDLYQPTRVGAALRKRQMAACDTLLIAYVAEDFGAFGDQQLKDRFRQRRKQLLEHPAVCEVRLNDVIDRDYRDALRDAGAGSGRCMQIRPWFTAGDIEGFEPEDDTGEGGEGGLGGAGEGQPRGGGRALSKVAVVAALATIALAAARRMR